MGYLDIYEFSYVKKMIVYSDGHDRCSPNATHPQCERSVGITEPLNTVLGCSNRTIEREHSARDLRVFWF